MKNKSELDMPNPLQDGGETARSQIAEAVKPPIVFVDRINEGRDAKRARLDGLFGRPFTEVVVFLYEDLHMREKKIGEIFDYTGTTVGNILAGSGVDTRRESGRKRIEETSQIRELEAAEGMSFDELIRQSRAAGMSYEAIGERFKLDSSTVHRFAIRSGIAGEYRTVPYRGWGRKEKVNGRQDVQEHSSPVAEIKQQAQIDVLWEQAKKLPERKFRKLLRMVPLKDAQRLQRLREQEK